MVPKYGGGIFETLGETRLIGLHYFFQGFPLESKDLLTLGGQADIKAFLRSRHLKKAASAGIRPRRVYGLGMTGCKVTVAWLTICKS